MAVSGIAEIDAAASMEDHWMFSVWKSCWGWCRCEVKAKTMTMVMEGCPTAVAFPSVFFSVFPVFLSYSVALCYYWEMKAKTMVMVVDVCSNEMGG